MDIQESNNYVYKVMYRKWSDDGFNYFIDVKLNDLVDSIIRHGPIPLPLLDDLEAQLKSYYASLLDNTLKRILEQMKKPRN